MFERIESGLLLQRIVEPSTMLYVGDAICILFQTSDKKMQGSNYWKKT
jgi:hypothetical protein